MKFAIVSLLVLGACVGDSDPRWQLDHDHVVAVRASPPHLASGARATLDALVAHAGAPTSVDAPVEVRTDDGMLGSTIQADGTVLAPDLATLAQVRAARGLAADAPVPLRLITTFGADAKVATKTIYLGDTGGNPAMPTPTLEGAALGEEPITVPAATDVALAIAVDPTWEVAWLSSCGTLHDDDLPDAVLRVEPDDPQAGELAVVVRDGHGGVAWQVWPIATAP
ncbi:MAG: hypothetical protein K8W52_47360 [Deltaproteobacteria bacterium]|nr:hypothetical protein [Deltaproteobacteria bacterium]